MADLRWLDLAKSMTPGWHEFTRSPATVHAGDFIGDREVATNEHRHSTFSTIITFTNGDRVEYGGEQSITYYRKVGD